MNGPQRIRHVRGLRLPRRTLLRGLGGVALGLPLLESMLGSHGERMASAQGDELPRRYGIVFAGQATGADNYDKDSHRVAGESFTESGHHISDTPFGTDYPLTTPLLPLSGLQGDFSLISRMSIPFNDSSLEGDAVPSAGAFRDFHGGGCSPLLSGVRSTSPSFQANGITSDQVVANALRGQTLFDSLVYRVQPSWYLAGSSYAGRQYISYAGERDPIEAQVSPAVAYQSLFANFSADTTVAQSALELRRRQRISVLDLIEGKRDRVLRGLSAADRQRLEDHYDQLRELEGRLDDATSVAMGECSVLQAPDDDPPIGGDNAGSGSDTIQTNTGYSNEALRAELLVDLIHMAMVCDLTRVFTLQLTVFQSHMNVYPFTSDMGLPIRADLHEVGHNGDADNRGQIAVSTCLQWHVQFYARLISKMKATPEGNGTLLDGSAVFFMPEAGHGRQLNDAVTENQTHSVENMALILAGRAGGLLPGRHIDASGFHPAQALASGIRAAGVDVAGFGETSGGIDALFG